MIFQLEVVLICYFQLNLFDFRHNKFFDSAAIHADQVVMVLSGRDVFIVLHGLTKVVLG